MIKAPFSFRHLSHLTMKISCFLFFHIFIFIHVQSLYFSCGSVEMVPLIQNCWITGHCFASWVKVRVGVGWCWVLTVVCTLDVLERPWMKRVCIRWKHTRTSVFLRSEFLGGGEKCAKNECGYLIIFDNWVMYFYIFFSFIRFENRKHEPRRTITVCSLSSSYRPVELQVCSTTLKKWFCL